MAELCGHGTTPRACPRVPEHVRFDAPGPDRAMVFQEHGLFPWLSALANVEFGLKMAGVSKSERQDRAASPRFILLPTLSPIGKARSIRRSCFRGASYMRAK